MNHGFKVVNAEQHEKRSRFERNPEDWIQEMCVELSDSTGWPISFLDSNTNQPADQTEEEVIDHCWVTELTDGKESFGHLRVDLPQEGPADCSFPMVRELVELFGELVSQCTSSHKLTVNYTEEMSALANMDYTCSTETNLKQRLSSILDVAVKLTGFREAGFFLLRPESKHLQLRARTTKTEFTIPEPDRVIGTGSPEIPILKEGFLQIRRSENSEYQQWLPQEAAMGLGVVVQSEAGPLGTIWFWDRRDKEPTEREIHVLQTISSQIAQMLEKVVLMKESAVQRRMQHDLVQASACQPEQIVEYQDETTGWEAAGICTSRFELGGDLFELLPLDKHRTLIAVGDASGDSVPAAMVMSTVRGSIRSLVNLPKEELNSPELLMSRVNRVLYDVTPSHQFMSMLIGVLDTQKKTFRYSNAGHPTPFYSNAGEVEELHSHGVLLGVLEDAEYEASELNMKPQNLLVFYSDGISEAMNQRKKLFRSDGILAGMKNQLNGSAQDVFEEIWSNMEGHRQGGDEPDDRTLVVLRTVFQSS